MGSFCAGNSDVMAGLGAPHHRVPDVPSWGQATPYGGGDVRTAVSREAEAVEKTIEVFTAFQADRVTWSRGDLHQHVN
jgi:hypothetical protein